MWVAIPYRQTKSTTIHSDETAMLYLKNHLEKQRTSAQRFPPFFAWFPTWVIACSVAFSVTPLGPRVASGEAKSPTGAPAGSPVAVNGALSTHRNHIVNAAGEPVQLRGVCTHGLQWHGDLYADGKAIEAVAKQWGADVIRISVYVYEKGYLDNPKLEPEDFDKMIDNIVQACVRAGVYCIIDWHVHRPGDPALYLKDARNFFAKMSKKYAHLPNVLYEIANEPNRTMHKGDPDGREILWKDIAAYANVIIPIIRKNAPHAMVLVGTPAWSSLGASAGLNWRDITDHPLQQKNVAYVVHVYAASHTFHGRVDSVAAKLPLFVTEWAAASYRRDSKNDLKKAKPWVELFNRHKISWTYWNPLATVFSACSIKPPSPPDRSHPLVPTSPRLAKSFTVSSTRQPTLGPRSTSD